MSALACGIGQNEAVAPGKRVGERHTRGFQPILLVLALGVTASLVAWGYLVFAAIDFGSTARHGDGTAWWFLALASLGAVACLFVALILVNRIIRTMGLTRSPETDANSPGTPERPGGGHRSHR